MSQKMRDLSAENKVRGFYDNSGWDADNEGVSLDAQLWEDLRDSAKEYVAACRRKLLAHLPKTGELFLDAASGPIQYPEYLEYSEGFKKRVCVDISQKALDQAKKKLGDRGEYVCTSMLELPFPDNHFDAIVSLHTIYHIDKDQQKDAVRQLIRVAKQNTPIVIIYANPDRLLARLKRLVPTKKAAPADSKHLYYFAHPLKWWDQFSDECSVEIESWRTLTAQDSRRFIPNSSLGAKILKAVLRLEKFVPTAAAWAGAYPMVVLQKRSANSASAIASSSNKN